MEVVDTGVFQPFTLSFVNLIPPTIPSGFILDETT